MASPDISFVQTQGVIPEGFEAPSTSVERTKFSLPRRNFLKYGFWGAVSAFAGAGVNESVRSPIEGFDLFKKAGLENFIPVYSAAKLYSHLFGFSYSPLAQFFEQVGSRSTPDPNLIITLGDKEWPEPSREITNAVATAHLETLGLREAELAQIYRPFAEIFPSLALLLPENPPVSVDPNERADVINGLLRQTIKALHDPENLPTLKGHVSQGKLSQYLAAETSWVFESVCTWLNLPEEQEVISQAKKVEFFKGLDPLETFTRHKDFAYWVYSRSDLDQLFAGNSEIGYNQVAMLFWGIKPYFLEGANRDKNWPGFIREAAKELMAIFSDYAIQLPTIGGSIPDSLDEIEGSLIAESAISLHRARLSAFSTLSPAISFKDLKQRLSIG